MNARKRKSKKQSVANSKQHNNPIFFIDEALGKHQISKALIRAGEKVEIHNDIFPSGSDDSVWISYVGRNNRLALTKDKRIKYRYIEIELIKKYKAKIFRFTSGNITGKEMAEIVVNAKENIKRFASNNNGPFIVAITRTGKLNKLKLDN